MDETEYAALLAEAAALVHASRAEGYGLPLVEALAAGTPVVCSDLPIFREVAGGAAGYAAPDDDATTTPQAAVGTGAGESDGTVASAGSDLR